MPTLHRTKSATARTFSVCQSCVGHLLLACRPAHVTRRVWSVVVDAVKRQVRGWSRPNVLVERREALSPPVAYVDASRSVVAICAVLWIVAPLNDGSPERVFGTGAQAVRPSALMSSTGLRPTFSQVPYKDLFHCAAFTVADEMTQTRSPRALGDHGPSANDSSSRHRTT
jgi:hypothetical protein